MKKIVLILMAITFAIGNVNSQVKRTPAKRTTTKVAAKPKKVVDSPVEVKDSVICFDFSVNSIGNFYIQTGESYYIVPFSKKNAHELYSDMLVRIARLYKSPETVTEKVEDRTIIINGYASQITSYYYTLDYVQSDTKYHSIVDLSYKLEFNFKDGKVRVNPPSISGGEELSLTTGSKKHSVYMDKIYKHDKSAIKKIENYFNELITALVYGHEKDEDW